jgi:hypothetical protein
MDSLVLPGVDEEKNICTPPEIDVPISRRIEELMI